MNDQNTSYNFKNHELLIEVFDRLDSAVTYFEAIRSPDHEVIDLEIKASNKQARDYLIRYGKVKSESKDILGIKLLELDPGYAQTVFKDYTQVIESGNAFETEYSFEYDGSSHELRNKISKLNDGVLVISHDISNQKSANDHLEDNEDFHHLADSSGLLVWSGFSDGRIYYTNDYFKTYTGLKELPIEYKDWIELIHSEDYLQLSRAWEEAVAQNKNLYIKCRIRQVDGSYRWHLCKSHPVLKGQASVGKWIGNAIDIHDEVLLQEQLDSSNREANRILEMIPQLVWTTDEKGQANYFNSNWLSYTGKCREDIIGDGWLSSLHPEDREQTKKVWMEAVISGKQYDAEYRIKSASGEYRWFLAKGEPLRNEENEIVRWFGTCTDINLQKELNQQKDDFLAITGHELRTPLTSILANEQLILEMIDEGLDGQSIKEYVERVYRSSFKMKSLIDDLIDFSTIRSGSIKLEKTTFNICQVITQTIEQIEFHYRTHRIKLEGCEEIMFTGDQARIGQLISNLLINAIKYSPGENEVLVKVFDKGEEVVLQVTDYGIGMTESISKDVFKKFFRAVNGPQFKGLGLGLFIVQQIVEFHQGTVSVESHSGKGSTFTVKLPL